MLKKKIAIVFAAAMMTLSASSAFAAFADLELIRVVYERTTGTTELATDLGKAATIAGTIKSGVTTVGTGGTFAGSLPTVTNAANLYAAYFGYDRVTGELWVSGSTDIAKAPVSVGPVGLTGSMNAGSLAMYNYYNTLTADANGVVTGVQTFGNSYKSKLSASQGALGNAINIATRVNTEGSLASIATAPVTQNLYYFANAKIAGSKGVKVATITTSSNGSTSVTTTPIPAAFYLMGSGLMGLVGLRRRNKA